MCHTLSETKNKLDILTKQDCKADAQGQEGPRVLELAADFSISGRQDGHHQKKGAQHLTGERVLSLKKLRGVGKQGREKRRGGIRVVNKV